MSDIGCTIKTLQQNEWATAAAKAIQINPANAPPVDALRAALPDTVIQPDHLALLTAKRWAATGVRLTVGFLDNPAADLRARIISHMNAWGAWSNVQFSETAVNPK